MTTRVQEILFCRIQSKFEKSICVSSFYKEVQKLYRRLGYERIGVLKDFIVSGYEEILLRKTIAPLDKYKKG